jgi:hypothetical protein
MYKGWTRKNLISGHIDEENVPPELPRIILVIHGVRNVKQAIQLYETIEGLRDFSQWLEIVVITQPQLLHQLSDSVKVIMERLCMMHLPDTGAIIYSGNYSSPPMFYEVCKILTQPAHFSSCLESLFATIGRYSLWRR